MIEVNSKHAAVDFLTSWNGASHCSKRRAWQGVIGAI